MTLIELRDALAKAAGPDLELDRDIALWLGWTYDGTALQYRWCRPDGMPELVPAPVTASIAAAVTLVPEGGWVDVLYQLPSLGWRARICVGSMTGNAEREDYANAALALCAARVEYEIAKGQS